MRIAFSLPSLFGHLVCCSPFLHADWRWALFAYVRAIYDVVESRSIFYQPAMGGSTRGYEILQTYSKIHDDSIAAAAAAVGSISFDLMLYTTHGHNNGGGRDDTTMYI